MKVIIAGSRDQWIHGAQIISLLEKAGFKVTEVVSGGARGIDRAGEEWANFLGLPIKRFIPEWHRHGPSAGPKRNKDMAAYADALLAIWDGKSRGTRHMIGAMRKQKKPVYIHLVEE